MEAHRLASAAVINSAPSVAACVFGLSGFRVAAGESLPYRTTAALTTWAITIKSER